MPRSVVSTNQLQEGPGRTGSTFVNAFDTSTGGGGPNGLIGNGTDSVGILSRQRNVLIPPVVKAFKAGGDDNQGGLFYGNSDPTATHPVTGYFNYQKVIGDTMGDAEATTLLQSSTNKPTRYTEQLVVLGGQLRADAPAVSVADSFSVPLNIS